MGCGSYSTSDFVNYSRSVGKLYDTTTKTVTNQVYRATKIDKALRPKNIMRECCNNKEHPNTVPVILALDVTGSMGTACKRTAEALNIIMEDVMDKYKDVEFAVMGIGDLAYDDAPIQMSQFESDVRIAESMDKVYMEHGGGGNDYESYTAAWYMGLKHTKLDAYDKQGRKGIIITMGDEALNPYLPHEELSEVTGDKLQGDVETKDLYESAKEKFDIYHIAIDDSSSCYSDNKRDIEKTFGKLLGENYKVATINSLPHAITSCLDASLKNSGSVSFASEKVESSKTKLNESGEITW